MTKRAFSFAAALAAAAVFSPAIARADVVGSCGGHHGHPISCGNVAGSGCDVGGTLDGTGGTCESLCADAGTDADGGALSPSCTLTCVPTMHGALTPQEGSWKFFAPWALAFVVPVALRKRRRA